MDKVLKLKIAQDIRTMQVKVMEYSKSYFTGETDAKSFLHDTDICFGETLLKIEHLIDSMATSEQSLNNGQ